MVAAIEAVSAAVQLAAKVTRTKAMELARPGYGCLNGGQGDSRRAV